MKRANLQRHAYGVQVLLLSSFACNETVAVAQVPVRFIKRQMQDAYFKISFEIKTASIPIFSTLKFHSPSDKSLSKSDSSSLVLRRKYKI
jgi:hypothetical protein